MASRLEFHWLPAIKYTVVLMVYILAGSVLIFYIEECKNEDMKESKIKKKVFTGNITTMCVSLAANILTNSNETRMYDKQLSEFMSKCSKLLSMESFVDTSGREGCSWSWKSIRKWIKFVHNTLATIGYHEFKVKTEIGKSFLAFYCCIGVPLAILCYIHFGRIVRISIRRTIRRIEAHFCNREEPLNIRHKVLFYNSILIIIALLLYAAILRLNSTQWSFIECIYYATGIISTSGNDGLLVDTTFFENHMSLSILLDIIQILGLGLVSSLIQAGVEYQRAKHKRQRLDLHDRHKLLNSESRATANGPKNFANGTIAMDSVVILVKNDEMNQ